MTDPIAALEELNRRWPGFFDVIKASNGFEVEGVGYEQFMTLNKVMIEDQEGMEIAMRAFKVLHASPNPEHRAWLDATGFVSREVIELTTRLEDLEAALTRDDIGEEEKSQVIRELEVLQEQARRQGERGQVKPRGPWEV